MQGLKRLLNSSKFLVAVADATAVALTTLVGPKLGLSEEQTANLTRLLVTVGVTLILAIMGEDVAAKLRGNGGAP